MYSVYLPQYGDIVRMYLFKQTVSINADIVQFLENVSSLVGDLFDNAYFQEINWTLNNAYLVLGQHHGQLTSAAEAFCTHGGTPEGILCVATTSIYMLRDGGNYCSYINNVLCPFKTTLYNIIYK